MADGTVRLRVAPERSPCGALDPLRGRGAEHPPARPGLGRAVRGKPARDLHTVQGRREGRDQREGRVPTRAKGAGRTGGSGAHPSRAAGAQLSSRVPVAPD